MKKSSVYRDIHMYFVTALIKERKMSCDKKETSYFWTLSEPQTLSLNYRNGLDSKLFFVLHKEEDIWIVSSPKR